MLSVFPELLDYREIAPLFLRIGLALVFLGLGYAKIFREFAPTANIFRTIGIKPEKFWVYFIGSLEIASGIMFILGIFTQIAAITASLTTLFMVVKIKRKTGFIGGWDFELLVLVAALSLLVLGPGIFSFDLPL